MIKAAALPLFKSQQNSEYNKGNNKQQITSSIQIDVFQLALNHFVLHLKIAWHCKLTRL